MSMNDLFGTAGSKPKLITAYTSGTGTYVPTADMARCLVRVQAGGGGGFSSASGGGGGGAMIEFIVRVPIAGLAYVVGAGGAVSTTGSLSSFGQFTANPGRAGASSSVGGIGGMLGVSAGTTNTVAVTLSSGSGLNGVNGGHGGNAGVSGGLVGFPMIADGSGNYTVSPAIGVMDNGNGQGTASGGDSFYGKGGTTGNAPAFTAYGAGGGSNAVGRGGYIEIWDYGV